MRTYIFDILGDCFVKARNMGLRCFYCKGITTVEVEATNLLKAIALAEQLGPIEFITN